MSVDKDHVLGRLVRHDGHPVVGLLTRVHDLVSGFVKRVRRKGIVRGLGLLQREHVGLGSRSVVDEIRVEWTDGRVTTLAGVAANRAVVISPSSQSGGDCDANGSIDFRDLVRILFAFGTYEGRCDPDLSGSIGFSDLIESLVRFGPCE